MCSGGAEVSWRGGAGRGERAFTRPDGEPLGGGRGGARPEGVTQGWRAARRVLAGSWGYWRAGGCWQDRLRPGTHPDQPWRDRQGPRSCYKYSSHRLSLAGTSLDAIEEMGRRKLLKTVVTMTFNLPGVSWLVEIFTVDLWSGKSPDTPGAPAWAPGEDPLWAGVGLSPWLGPSLGQ